MQVKATWEHKMGNNKTERRFIPFTQFELREAEGKPPELVGHASVFNQETVISGWFDEWREEVAPGAFKKTIKEGDIRSCFNHDVNIVLGRNKAGTLDLSEDDIGLLAVIRPPDNEWGRPVIDAVKRGDVTGMSVMFSPVKEEWWFPGKDSQELPKRTLKEAKLYELGPVTFPAFEQTDISARAKAIQTASDDDILLLAGRLVGRAQHGYKMTSEERGLIANAIDLLENVSEEPAGPDHSSSVTNGEPDTNHSAEARARRLRLIHILQGE
jgi:uncharacterized protein